MREIRKVTLPVISEMRKQFLSENNIQFVLDKCHRYGWADTYVFSESGAHVGYGAVWGKDNRHDRDAIFEFYIYKDFGHLAKEFFEALCIASKALWIECQSNDKFLFPLFEKFSLDGVAEAFLFADDHATYLRQEGTSLVNRPQGNPDDCQYILVQNGEQVGEGGFMLNYNFPYADIYYSVDEIHRRKGFGSFFVQELKKEIYRMGRVPSARCNVTNSISKATMIKAGMVVCGTRLVGRLKM